MVQVAYSRQAGNYASAFSYPAVWLDKPEFPWGGWVKRRPWELEVEMPMCSLALQDRAFQHPHFTGSRTGEWVRGAPSTPVPLNMEPLWNGQASWQGCRPLCPSAWSPWASCSCWVGPLSSACMHVPPGEGRCWCCAAAVGVADVASLEWDQMSVANSWDLTSVLKILWGCYSLLSCSTNSSFQPFHPTLRLQQHPRFLSGLHPNAVWQPDTFPLLNLIKTVVVMVY